MDVVERLTPEQAADSSLIALTHRHRYELAAELFAGKRVLDLCCGSGYGAELLAETASAVVGVDLDPGAIAAAKRSYGGSSISFSEGDATALLDSRLGDRYDAIVMFEGLEHVLDLERTIAGLARQAADGVGLAVSLPNGIPFGEENRHHRTEFDELSARAALSRVGEATILRQFHAEGSLIRADGDGSPEGESRFADSGEPELCNHLIALFNAGGEVATAPSARMRMVLAPQQNSYMLDLERANKRLWRTNQELARERLGKADSAAAALLAKIPPEPEEEPPPPPSRWEPLLRIGRRVRTAVAMILPHGLLVLNAKYQEGRRALEEEEERAGDSA